MSLSFVSFVFNETYVYNLELVVAYGDSIVVYSYNSIILNSLCTNKLHCALHVRLHEF